MKDKNLYETMNDMDINFDEYEKEELNDIEIKKYEKKYEKKFKAKKF